jgi:alkanesulfonate monooxygenase SsuD/methylene tetrahydromethanopterin reductase-like flavin-dependent oxidoreductase (luciferase family)
MNAISEGSEVLKVVHTYGAGLHYSESEPDVHDPQWQKRQVDDFVRFAVEAEELGYDGITVTEHHAPLMVCPSPHILLAAAAVRTSKIRLGSAVTVLPLYNPVRVAEEAGMLDLLSGGRFELGLGRGVPGEALYAIGRELSSEQMSKGWSESLDLLELALTGRDFTFDGEFFKVVRPTTIATRPLQENLPIWIGAASLGSVAAAARRGWSLMRNLGSNEEHRAAIEHFFEVAGEHGHAMTGGNVMIERFVALGHTEEEAELNLDRMSSSFGRFLKLFMDTGRALPERDGELQAAKGSGNNKRPAIAVGGTPDAVIKSLQETLDATGAKRLLVEIFSDEERRMFVDEVLPALSVSGAAERPDASLTH